MTVSELQAGARSYVTEIEYPPAGGGVLPMWEPEPLPEPEPESGI
jgi:hypothetical protein